MQDSDARDAATGGPETTPDAGDDGNPDAAAGVGARSGYGIDTGEENEGYPNTPQSSDTTHQDEDNAGTSRSVDADTSS
jgi:hypothetical protein